MTFQQQLVSTLLGVFCGFMGSLILFWIKEAVTKASYRKNLVSNLGYELQYNISLFEKWEEELTKCIESTSADNRNSFLHIDYQYIARFFAIQFYQSGLIQKYFDHEDMKRWNDFMVNLGIGSQTYVLAQLDEWRSGKLSKDAIFNALDLERGGIRCALKTARYIKCKLTT